MAKTKPELLEEAKKLKLEVTVKNTVAEINQAIKDAKAQIKEQEKNVIAQRETEVAKAGKRSEKAIKEVEAKAEKEARKAAESDDADAPIKKGPAPKTRSILERRGKNYQAAEKKIDRSKTYSLEESVELIGSTSPVKFDASVEVHVKLGVDPRQADQNIRSTVSLPHGNGKKITIAVFAPKDAHKDAKSAGAEIVEDEEFLQQLSKEILNFDILITTPQYMSKLGKYARLLGPRGLMPNPKNGTISIDLAKAVSDAKAGKVEYRVDKQAIVHLSVGKASFTTDKLLENSKAFFDSLQAQKPAGLKGSYIKSVYLSTSQGPSIKVNLN